TPYRWPKQARKPLPPERTPEHPAHPEQHLPVPAPHSASDPTLARRASHLRTVSALCHTTAQQKTCAPPADRLHPATDDARSAQPTHKSRKNIATAKNSPRRSEYLVKAS